MSVSDSLSAAVFSRRRVVTWAATAVAAGATLKIPGVFAVAAAQESTAVFLDATVIHDIKVSFDQTIYDAMIETFKETGDKEWIEVDIVIDGSTYEQSAMRLKGNSSLGGLGGMGEGGPINILINEDGTPVTVDPEQFFSGDGTPEANSPDGGGFNTEGPGGGATAEEPEGLPWLISLDKYVDDQNHNGLKELVIRSNGSQTALNEVISLELLTLAGLASQLSAEVRFTVNDGPTKLRLAIEHPNDEWMAAHFSEDGLLFKGEAGGDYNYRGDDPASYADIFDLEAGGTKDDAEDFKPLFSLLAFLNDSDDTTFNAEFEQHIDVPGFAIYTAMMDVLSNPDNISGPGNNAYLYIGPDSEQFTVVPWDMNLAFGGMGGMRGPEGENGGPITFPANTVGIPEINGTPVAGESFEQGARGPGMGDPNILVKRSETYPGFTDLVASETTRLKSELYESGKAAEVLAKWVDLLKTQASDLVSEETIASESESISRQFI